MPIQLIQRSPHLSERGVAVDLHRHPDVGMPDDLPDQVRRDANRQQHGDAGVPEVVQPDLAQPDPISQRVPAPAHVVRLQLRANDGGEDVVSLLPQTIVKQVTSLAC